MQSAVDRAVWPCPNRIFDGQVLSYFDAALRAVVGNDIVNLNLGDSLEIWSVTTELPDVGDTLRQADFWLDVEDAYKDIRF